MKKITQEMIPAYTIISETDISELSSRGYLLKHNNTGARVALLVNDDKNKVFNIAFRTPPTDDTGVAHIIEHSVLCGSKKYPVKNPFEELVQGSLNTFLNAITYPDKTMYPVASCNTKDFNNLMDVYLDGVFNPNIYTEREIFMQEGWHYEIDDDGSLIYNGVVYNEMKGAFSEPDDVLEKNILHELYPDTCYSFESGGNPENIPELTYESFLEFHKKYYHPSNSYIYFYGDADMAERLSYLDREYLSKYDRLDIDSKVAYQKPFEHKKVVEGSFSVGQDESTQDKGMLAYSVAVDTALDRMHYYAFSILSYALLNVPGAPLKKALTDAGIGKSISGGYEKNLYQPDFVITAKDVDTDKVAEFENIIDGVLTDLVKNGIDKKALKAAINVLEFQYREADFGRYPKGLYYLLYVMDAWLYDDEKPFIHIQAGDTFKKLNDKVDSGYFEELIDKYILKNNHKVIYALKPERGLDDTMDNALADKLRILKDSLGEGEIKRIAEEDAALKLYQSEPSPREDVEKIPLIELSDIAEKPEPYVYELSKEPVTVVFSPVASNGIGYITASFDCRYVPANLIPYVGFLENILGNMDTQHYQYCDLNNEMNMHSGGMILKASVYNLSGNDEKCSVRFEVKMKVFYNEIPFAFRMMEEILLHTVVDDEKRLREIVDELVTDIRTDIISSGDMAAFRRGLSCVNQSGAINDVFNGIGAYELFSGIQKNFDKNLLTYNIKKVIELIFDKKNLIISYAAEKDSYDELITNLCTFCKKLPDRELKENHEEFRLNSKNQAIIIPSPVSYVARVGNFKRAGYEYTGVLDCLENILDYGYLWNLVRIKGGAYGVMSTYQTNSGNMGFRSYRDPNVEKTADAYMTVADYLEGFEADDREIKKYIIGAINALDVPLTPRAAGDAAFESFITGRTYEDRVKERKQVLGLTVDAVRNTGKMIDSVMKQGYICAVGNREKIMEAKHLFDEIKEIFS